MSDRFTSSFILFFLCFILAPKWTSAQIDTTSIHLIDSLLSEVQAAFDRKDPDAALLAAVKGEEQAREMAGEQSYAFGEAIFQEGRALRFLGKNAEAEEKYLTSLEIYRQVVGEVHPAVATNLFNLGALQFSVGRYDESAANLNHSQAIRKVVFGEHHLVLVENFNWLTDVFFRKGQYALALTYADSALQVLMPQVEESNPEFTKSLYWKALLLGTLGQYEESENAYRRLLDIRIKTLGKDSPETAAVMNNLGLLYWRVGRYAEAEELWLETLRIREKSLGSDHPLTIRTMGNMGIFYFDTGNMEKAEVYFQQNLEGLAKTTGKDDPDYARALNNLSSLYQDWGDLAKAEPLVKEGLDILEKKLGRRHPDFAISLYNFAGLNVQMGRLDIARTALREVESIRRQTLGNHHYDLGITLTALGRLERTLGNVSTADSCLREAISVLDESVGENHPDFVEALIERAHLEILNGHQAAAIGTFRDIARLDQAAIQQALYYLSDVEILKYLYWFRSHQNWLLAYAAQSGDSELAGIAYDQTLFLKGFLLYARQKMVRTAMTDPEGKEIYNNLKEEYSELSREMTKQRTDRDSLLVTRLMNGTNQLEKDLARAVGKLGMELGPVKWQDVQKQLQAEEAAIEFVSYVPYPGAPTDSTVYAALILKPGSAAPHMTSLFRESELSGLLDVKKERRSDYVNDLYAYAERGMAPTEEARASLMKLIWNPISTDIGGMTTLYVAPTGVLHRLNLAAIPTSEETVLADRYHMVFLGSTRHLVSHEENPGEAPLTEAFIFGGIRFDPDSLSSANSQAIPTARGEEPETGMQGQSRGRTWSYLSWTAKEARTIADIMADQGIETRTFSEEKASEENFKGLARGIHGTRILHLATHGFFFPDPAVALSDKLNEQPAFEDSDDPMIRSGLVLANGNYAWQYGQPLEPDMEDGILTAFEISQLDLSGTELVVLSACETGLGDIEGNEGVYGLQRAFKIAGAKYLIMSLWQVPDRETMQFMTTFYRNWLEEKMAIPEAFRKTQLEMRDRFFNPYSWAGFVLVE